MRLSYRIVEYIAVLLITITATSSQALNNVHFGIHTMVDGTPDYQAVSGYPTCGWKTSLTNINTLHSNFATTMSNHATMDYYYNIQGKAYYWEETGDHNDNSLETVDLFFTVTHGQAAPRPAYSGDCGLSSDPADSNVRSTWSMWNVNSRARSDQMRLGDERTGLSVFASYSCSTQKWDSNTWTRWNKIFKGGLRMSVGFKEATIYCASSSCPAQYQHTTSFANYLGAGWLINNAWILAFDDNDGYGFNPIVFSSGNSDADCASRRDNMTMNNFRDYTRRRDNQMTRICTRYWNNAD